jgi:hypothetical protein
MKLRERGHNDVHYDNVSGPSDNRIVLVLKLNYFAEENKRP